jgi:hypothetical protein
MGTGLECPNELSTTLTSPFKNAKSCVNRERSPTLPNSIPETGFLQETRFLHQPQTDIYFAELYTRNPVSTPTSNRHLLCRTLYQKPGFYTNLKPTSTWFARIVWDDRP